MHRVSNYKPAAEIFGIKKEIYSKNVIDGQQILGDQQISVLATNRRIDGNP